MDEVKSGFRAAAVMVIGLGLLALIGAGSILGWWDRTDGGDLVNAAASFFFLGLGSLIIWRADSNRVGWVFAGIGLTIVLSGVAAGLSDRGLLIFDALGGAFWLSWFGAVGLLLLWFPTGRVPGGRWLWLQGAGFGLLGVVFVSYLFAEELCSAYVDGQGCVDFASNPIGLPGIPNPEYGWVSGPLSAGLAVFVALSLVSLGLRYLRSGPTERLQLKWFFLACSTFAVTLTLLVLVGESAPTWLNAVFGLSVMGIPVAATLGILRYRLYEIDRIISRTVSYAFVVGVLALTVAAVATAAGSRFQTPWVVAATTLGVAGLFNPLRRRVQEMVDRRFNRSRYDAEQVVVEFTGALRHGVGLAGVVDGWVGVVSETMQPAWLQVWVRGGPGSVGSGR